MTTVSPLLQFEGAYNPRRLRNWEVPERWPSKRAAFGRAHHQPRPIANDRGHLLPGVPRGPRGPWGCYRGTWELPRRITRKQAEELSVVNPPVRPPPVEPSSWQKRSASSVPVPERSQAAQEAIDRAAEAAPQPQEDQQEAGPVSATTLPTVSTTAAPYSTVTLHLFSNSPPLHLFIPNSPFFVSPP
ncbi:protein Flattop homolog [Schistocerca americana]|uniref:protein Flattop homolog n=1 Tax=Schistocerca americana TaxID=7009 RepID=UPI001F4FA729|nr:protein Flattop homolog [Schistocerca americana]